MRHVFSGVGIFFGLFCVVTCFLGCRTVPTGYVGVKTRLGAAFKDELNPGAHLVIPYIDSVALVDVKLRTFEVKSEDSCSNDLQKILTTISIQHSLNEEMASEAYAKVGDIEQIDAKIIQPAVAESMKAVISQYSAEQLIKQRVKVKTEIDATIHEFINHALENKQIPNAVHIDSVAITNFDFSNEFNASIEAKVKAEQDSLRAENEKKKRVTEAEASAREQTLAAEAIAFKIEIESKARAEASRREAEALKDSGSLLQLRTIEKWDGKLPYYNGVQGVPFLNLK